MLLAAVALVNVLSSCDDTPEVGSGTVTAAPSSAGVGGVVVQVYADDSETLVAQTTSDIVGVWRLRASTVTDGTYRVRIGDRWWPDAASWGEADSVALSAASPPVLDASFAEVGDLAGGVVDDDGAAIQGVWVAVVRASDGQPVGLVQTDASGQFSIPVIASDSYRVLIVDASGTWPWVFVGGATPTDFGVTAGAVPVGTIRISTGLPYAVAGTGSTTRVSVTSDGAQADSWSDAATVSGDGRYVAFRSAASNLVSGDTNATWDVFVHDRSTGGTTRVSVASDGTQANNGSYLPAISGDGRYVTFMSLGTNLVPGDTNGSGDVFVHDRQTGETSRVSVSSAGVQSSGEATTPAISRDGRFVAFVSSSSNLVAGDTGARDVFVHDRQTSTTTRVSISSTGTQANGPSENPAISHDGRYVTFQSEASTLVAGDTNVREDVFVHDRSTGETIRVSVASDGTQANGLSEDPAISGDGRWISFKAAASNLVAGDTNAYPDVFLHDRSTGETIRVSVSSSGTQANSTSYQSAISADGRYVTFNSSASNLVPDDGLPGVDVFVHDRVTGVVTVASVTPDGDPAGGNSTDPAISDDGLLLTFESTATTLVDGDTNGHEDVFVYQRPTS